MVMANFMMVTMRTISPIIMVIINGRNDYVSNTYIY